MEAPPPASPPTVAPPPADKPAPAPVPLIPAGHSVIFTAEQAPGLIKEVCFTAPEGITGYWMPTEADLVDVEVTLLDYLQTQKATDRRWPDFYRQVAGVQRGAARFLFLNYFVMSERTQGEGDANHTRAAAPNWKTTPYWVNDGGDWFFRVLYDLVQKKFVWYEHNNTA
jgi:hypothetical protein